MSKIIYHNHHIIPRHAGGTDDPSNLIRLTIPEHAEAHRVLWEEHGRLGDKLAWLMLSGRADEGELVRIELARTQEARLKMGHPNRGKVMSDETKSRISAANKGKAPWCKGKRLTEEHRNNLRKPKSDQHRANISAGRIGIKFSETHLHNLREAMKKRRKSSCHEHP